MATKYSASPAQIRAIKAAIKRHNMRAVTWQSIAARPDTIEQFLTATQEPPMKNLEDITPEILDRTFKAMRRHSADEIVGIHPGTGCVLFDITNPEIEGSDFQAEVCTAPLASAGYRTRLNPDHASYTPPGEQKPTGQIGKIKLYF
jgi:hypothetical protein